MLGDINQLVAAECGGAFTLDPTKTTKVRASITFRLGVGSGGTKSRDFPGRSFTQKERNLLQVWSAEWRRGDSVVHPEDQRFINLSSVEHGQRKAVLKKTLIRRFDAYEWFREKHALLMSNMPIMKATPDNPIVLQRTMCARRIDGLLPNHYQSGSTSPSHTAFIEVQWHGTHPINDYLITQSGNAAHPTGNAAHPTGFHTSQLVGLP